MMNVQLQGLEDQIADMDVEEAWTTVKLKLSNLREYYVPQYKAKPRRKSLWMSDHSKAKVKAKHAAWKKYMNTREGLDYDVYKRECRSARRAVR